MSLDTHLQELLDHIMAEYPELGDVLEDAKARNLPDHQVMEGLLQAVQGHPEMAERLQEEAMKILAPLREADVPAVVDEPALAVNPELIVYDDEGNPKRLNPLYEAALIERVQFDGDIPELRTGPLDPEVMPAVPVDTDARSPSALGHMLKAASRDVLEEVQESQRLLQLEVEKLAEKQEAGTDLIPAEANRDLIEMSRGSAETDPEGYRRGQVPALRTVEAPSGALLASMPSEERREAAWGFLSTSQGRRSAVRTIWEGIYSRLRAKEVDIQNHANVPFPARGKVWAHAEWTMDLSGELSTQAEFSLIDVAVGALSIRLLDDLEWPAPQVALEVFAINTVDVRSVGWAARLVEVGDV